MVIAARMMADEPRVLRIIKSRQIGLTLAARIAAEAEGSKFQELTAPTGDIR
jgi:hypothetical protein